MKKEKRSYRLYLEDMKVSMLRIAEYIEGLDFNAFKRDYKTVDAVVRNFEIIGEAAKKLPAEIREKYPSVPWLEMYYMRNRISHEYFGLDYEILWDIAKNHLPENLRDIEKIINHQS